MSTCCICLGREAASSASTSCSDAARAWWGRLEGVCMGRVNFACGLHGAKSDCTLRLGSSPASPLDDAGTQAQDKHHVSIPRY